MSCATHYVRTIRGWSHSPSWFWAMQRLVSLRAHRPDRHDRRLQAMCAAKLVKHNGGAVAREIAAFDVFRNHKGRSRRDSPN